MSSAPSHWDSTASELADAKRKIERLERQQSDLRSDIRYENGRYRKCVGIVRDAIAEHQKGENVTQIFKDLKNKLALA